MSGSSTTTATPTRPHPAFGAGCGQAPRRPDPRPARRPHRFTSLAAARSFSGLIPTSTPRASPTRSAARPTTATPAYARRCSWPPITPARPTHPGRPLPAAQVPDRPPPHPWALCTIATVLCTQIVACLRNNTPYQIRDVDGSPITPPRAERPSPRATRSHPKSCRPPNDQQPPQPPTRMGRAHRPRSRQALHDAAHPTASLNPARHLDNQ